jgi:acetyl-CoA acetyltransferase
VQLYDAFTINTILFLEDLGFCRKGEGGAFVSGGNIAPGGKLPVNTGGGLLSAYYMADWTPLVEAVTQLRGRAGTRQVQGARLAAVAGYGMVVYRYGACANAAVLEAVS